MPTFLPAHKWKDSKICDKSGKDLKMQYVTQMTIKKNETTFKFHDKIEGKYKSPKHRK